MLMILQGFKTTSCMIFWFKVDRHVYTLWTYDHVSRGGGGSRARHAGLDSAATVIQMHMTHSMVVCCVSPYVCMCVEHGHMKRLHGMHGTFVLLVHVKGNFFRYWNPKATYFLGLCVIGCP